MSIRILSFSYVKVHKVPHLAFPIQRDNTLAARKDNSSQNRERDAIGNVTTFVHFHTQTVISLCQTGSLSKKDIIQ